MSEDQLLEVLEEARSARVIEELPRAVGRFALLAGATQLIPRALNLVPPGSLQSGFLLAQYGVDLGRLQGNYEGAKEAFLGALDIAERGTPDWRCAS